MNIRTLLGERLSAALAAVGATDAPALVQAASKPEFGDYQANGVMAAAKRLKRVPRELAAEVIDAVDLDDVAERLEVAGPGFINIHLRTEFLAAQVSSDAPTVVATAHPERVVVDYSSPNLAKEMHVGHLRSTIIGDAMARLLEALGHSVIRPNHVGDWGTQVDMLITELEEQSGAAAQFELADIEAFYRQAKAHYDADPDFAQRARQAVVDLQAGDPAVRAQWQRFIDLSLEHCQALYARLGVDLNRDNVMPESAYNDALPGVVADLGAQGLLTESDGAACVFLPEFSNKKGEPLPVIVQKSDGGFLYASTDLAALRHRSDALKANRIIYVVDARQSLHFKQVFAVARKVGFVDANIKLEHLAFGTMLDASGKPFKTRDGAVVKLSSLLDAAESKAEDVLAQRARDDLHNAAKDIARTIGLGAVKYADLSKNRTTDYVFDLDAMIAFEGDTAPYLQYAFTRISSVFRKAQVEPEQCTGTPVLTEPAERALAVSLARNQEVLEQAAAEGYPHYLCNYLYDLASRYSRFYESCPILKSADPQRTSRLILCARTARTLEDGLRILGIDTLDAM